MRWRRAVLVRDAREGDYAERRRYGAYSPSVTVISCPRVAWFRNLGAYGPEPRDLRTGTSGLAEPSAAGVKPRDCARETTGLGGCRQRARERRRLRREKDANWLISFSQVNLLLPRHSSPPPLLLRCHLVPEPSWRDWRVPPAGTGEQEITPRNGNAAHNLLPPP